MIPLAATALPASAPPQPTAVLTPQAAISQPAAMKAIDPGSSADTQDKDYAVTLQPSKIVRTLELTFSSQLPGQGFTDSKTQLKKVCLILIMFFGLIQSPSIRIESLATPSISRYGVALRQPDKY